MPIAAPTDPKQEERLFQILLDPSIRDDPYAWVMTVFPWGKPNTPLANTPEPRAWQKRKLQYMARHIQRQKLQPAHEWEVLQMATASGRGIGKSAFFAMVAWWFFCTRIGSMTIIAANGKPQLVSYTLPELAKWISMACNAHWADITATKVTPARWLADLVKRSMLVDASYWYIEGKLWTEENPDAFAGAHNHKGCMVLYDEASGIPTPIWDVTKGYFTEPIRDRFWLANSNPRRNSGAFFDCFHANRHRWVTENIDSRTVEGLDHSVFHKLIEDNGEDSDIARVEVRGMFPLQGFDQFINPTHIREAQARELVPDPAASLIMAVDVARYGDDCSVVSFRRGRDARSITPRKYRGLSTMQLAARVLDLITQYAPDHVVVDGGGVGGGVVDRLRQMGAKVIEFDGGSSAVDSSKYLNMRVEVWDNMREWLKTGCITNDNELERDMQAPMLEFAEHSNQMQLESKKKMKARGLPSPDNADALAMTFVVRTDYAIPRTKRYQRQRQREYEPIDYC